VTAYYFNTNPLVSWAESKAPSPDPRSSKIGRCVEQLVNDPASITAVSEITLVEFHNKLCDHWRASETPQYDSAWADSVQAELMRWIADGQLVVLNQPPKLIEKAIAYVTFATREHGRRLKAWDAVHLFHASDWARDQGQKVNLVTSDADFPSILDVYPEFKEFVNILDPAT